MKDAPTTAAVITKSHLGNLKLNFLNVKALLFKLVCFYDMFGFYSETNRKRKASFQPSLLVKTHRSLAVEFSFKGSP